jgi:hypothetical protein
MNKKYFHSSFFMKVMFFVFNYLLLLILIAFAQKNNLPLDISSQNGGKEIVQHARGLIIPEHVKKYWKTHTPQLKQYEVTTLQASIDWSNNDSPVKNQRYCGSCWAFAAIALVENLSDRNDLSEQELVSCVTGNDCNGGWYFDALKYVKNYGVSPESCYPYTSTNGNCSSKCSDPDYLVKISNYTSEPGLWGEPANVNNIKAQLQNGPICVAMLVPEDGTFDYYSGGVYNYNGGYIPWGGNGHAVLIVGYNDSGQYFKVKNSWGSSWGESGYFRIAYDDVTDDVHFGMYGCVASGIYEEGGSSCSITVTSPNGSESWDEGTTQSITWNSIGTSGSVKIRYSTNGGSSWTTLISSTSDDGSWNWTLPTVGSDQSQCRIRVEDSNNSSCNDMSNGNFTIHNQGSGCSITVTSPNGGESWEEGSTQNITWNSNGTSGSVKIRHSSNGGSSWTTLTSSTSDDGSWNWTLPTVSSDQTQCRIRVEDSNNSSCNDMSNNDFTISNQSSTCSITVTSPNGGESWNEASTHNITWNSTGTSGSVKIRFSTNSGSSWTTLTSSTSDDGSWNWTLPTVSSDQTQCRIRVEDRNNSSCNDMSNGNFTIRKLNECSISITSPNGSEIWEEGSTHTITWNSSYASGNVLIRLSYDSGSSWNSLVNSTADDGSWDWTLPNVSSDQTQCLIRVEDKNNSNCYDISDGYFTIQKELVCSLILLSPNGDEEWTEGSEQNIEWSGTNTSGTVLIRLSYDSGDSWTFIEHATADDGSWTWTIPQVESDQIYCNIRVEDKNHSPCFDRGDNDFTIKNIPPPCHIEIADPNGGEAWDEGSTQNINWNSSNSNGFVKIQYSENSGSSWTILIESTPDDGSWAWTLPDVDSDQPLCHIRVEDTADSNCYDVSNSDFTIKHVPLLVDITGKIKYYAGNIPVPNVQLNLLPNNQITSSIDNGNYGFTDLEGEQNYEVTPSKDSGTDQSSVTISSHDAYQAAQIALGMSTQEQFQTIAADVDGDGEVLLLDASLIGRHVVGIELPESIRIGDWWFEPTERNYTFLDSNQSNQDYSAVVIGDVNGNWSMTNLMTQSSSTISNNLKFEFVDSNTIHLRAQFDEQIELSSIDLVLNYNSNELKYVGLNKYMERNVFHLVDNNINGTLKISGFANQPPNIEQLSAVFEIVFKKETHFKEQSEIEINRFLVNDIQQKERIISVVKETREAKIDNGFYLYQNYPNPFNADTKIEYNLPHTAQIRLVLFDVSGKEVCELVNEHKSAGHYSVNWNARDTSGKRLTSGIYFYRFEVIENENKMKSFAISKKMLLMK